MFKRILSLASLCLLVACNSSDKSEPTAVINELSLGTGSGDSFVAGTLASSVRDLATTGQTELSVSIVDLNNSSKLFTDETVSIEFTSSCITAGTATLSSSSVSTSTGTASTLYSSNGCTGSDVVTASLSGTGLSAITTISIAEPEVGSISSVIPDNTVLAIQGFSTNTLPAATEVSFVVLDKSGNPVVGKTVRFSLSGGTGGVSLSRNSALSDSTGTVSVFANSGTAHTSFRVVAETDILNEDGLPTGQAMQTTSTAISVTTGLPVARSFGSAVSIFNPRGWNYVSAGSDQGSLITITASDLYGGAILDNNTVTFTTLGGRLEESSCQLVNGTCAVRWHSSQPYLSTANLLAYTVGEEAFDDLNGNGQYDVGEVFYPLDEPYRDDNRDGNYDAGEFFVDSNLNGQWDAAVDSQSTLYRGASCSDEAKQLGHCATLAHISSRASVIMSGINISAGFFESDELIINDESFAEVTIPYSGVAYFEVLITDENGAIPPAGSAISIECNGSDVSSNSGQMLDAIPDLFAPSGLRTTLNVTVEPLETTVPILNRSTTCFINVEPEGGVGTGIPFIVNYRVADTGG